MLENGAFLLRWLPRYGIALPFSAGDIAHILIRTLGSPPVRAGSNDMAFLQIFLVESPQSFSGVLVWSSL